MEPNGADIAELRALAERSRGLLHELRGKTSQASDQRRESFESFGQEATQLMEEISAQLATELAADLVEQHTTEQMAETERLVAERKALDVDRSVLAEQTEQLATERAAFQSHQGASLLEQEAWLKERTEWESVRDEVEAELAKREEEVELRAAQVEDQLVHIESEANAELEQRFSEAVDRATLAEERVLEADQHCEQLFGEAEQLTTALAEANAQIESARQAEIELADLQEKFDIALQDLQQHREQVALLDEELATRPEREDAEAAELAQLRQERDELALQLENALREVSTTDESTELTDLRARFEMAVEDLRHLKTENAGLQEQLSAARATGPAETTGGNDWESQKRRLLASLEGEEEPNDTRRQEERTSIADTIQITDSVVAEKDSEIEQLRSELADYSQEGPSHVASAEEAALLDEDAIVQAERDRLAELEKEWEEKIRTAELEFSLERAKLSRAQKEIANIKIEFETQQGSGASKLGAAATEARHNWMNQLGLGNEGDE